MRITHEADYAIRVLYSLAVAGEKVSAKDISENTGVTLRFALKILRKLIQCNMVHSFKGMNGGYMLNRLPAEISLGEIIECIDGPIAINHCLSNEFSCAGIEQKGECHFHNVFRTINARFRQELYAVTLDQFLPINQNQNKLSF